MRAPSRPRTLAFEELERPVRTERPDARAVPVDLDDAAEVAVRAAGAVPHSSQ
jgi:hypothetical protein